MKCIRNLVTEEVTRVSDEEAAEKVKSRLYQYASKAEWKAKTREKSI